MRSTEKVQKSYIDCLCAQIDEYKIAASDYIVDSVYIGGGTPTALNTALLLRLVKKIKKSFAISKYAEFSVEVNPGTADKRCLKRLFAAGVNRLSIGLQSAVDSELRFLARPHTYNDFLLCYKDARSAGFKNINVDIMYGIPLQTGGTLIRTLKNVVKLKPEHISAYGLKIEEGTKFFTKRNLLPLPDEESERAMYFYIRSFLESAGFSQYEISNFSLPGMECRHNLKYWKCSEYLGLGVSAHSYFSGYRFSFKRNLKMFLKSFAYNRSNLENMDLFGNEKYSLFDDHIQIRPNERIAEYVMLAFRLVEGVSLNEFSKIFYRDFEDMYLPKILPFINSGHIKRTDSGYAFTPEGMYVSNYILSRIISFD